MRQLYTVSFILLLFNSTLGAQNWDYYPPSAVPDRIMLNLTAKPASQMAITWRTAPFIKKGYVQYTVVDASPDILKNAKVQEAVLEPYLSDHNGANYFSTVLDSLLSDTQYAYRTGDSTHWSEWAHFETASSENDSFSFIYFGDAQNDIKSMWSRTIRSAFQQMPKADFLLHAGDLINKRDRDHEWGEWYYAGGWIYRMIPSIATPGNHEYGNNEEGIYVLSKHWKPTFNLPENGPADLEETAYHIDYQNTRIISIDAPAFYRSKADSAKQVVWVDSLLRNNPQKWTIVTMHYPIYSTIGVRDNVELRHAFQPLFEKYKVDLVLQGHDHAYGRGTNLPFGSQKEATMDGPIYVVSVSGPKMYPVGLDKWMQKGASNTQLYQLLHVEGDTLKFEAFAVDGQLYDAFELRKKKGRKTTFVDLAPSGDMERLELPQRFKNSFSEEEILKYQNKIKEYKKRNKRE
ncbi:MAG: metallophosphoesterase family protein [Bacteroidota bacterium]